MYLIFSPCCLPQCLPNVEFGMPVLNQDPSSEEEESMEMEKLSLKLQEYVTMLSFMCGETGLEEILSVLNTGFADLKLEFKWMNTTKNSVEPEKKQKKAKVIQKPEVVEVIQTDEAPKTGELIPSNNLVINDSIEVAEIGDLVPKEKEAPKKVLN